MAHVRHGGLNIVQRLRDTNLRKARVRSNNGIRLLRMNANAQLYVRRGWVLERNQDLGGVEHPRADDAYRYLAICLLMHPNGTSARVVSLAHWAE